MRVAIDVDNTITRHPEQCRALMEALRRQFYYVCVLTEHLADPEEMTQRDHDVLYHALAAQLAALRIFWDSHYLHLQVVVGKNSEACATEKGRECKARSIELFIDDSKRYCEAVRKECPQTMILNVFD